MSRVETSPKKIFMIVYLFNLSLMIHITRETSTYIIIIVHEYVTCTSEEEPILPYMEVATIFGRLMSACAFRDIDYTTTVV